MQTITHPPAVSRRNILAAVIGNALEWYDFLAFAFMTPIVAKLFFPSNPADPDNNINQILLTTAVFGVGFFMRPVGGIVLGLYGDRVGRKPAMVMVTGLMAVAIAMITFAPTYAAVGIFAPLFIVLARLLQGFAAGGEFGTSTALLIELAPPGRRGYYGSWQMTGQMVALLLGASAGTLITEIFTQQQLMAWAWRIPFALGLLIVPVAIYIRRHMDEPESFLRVKAEQAAGTVQRATLGEMLRNNLRETLVGMGLVMTLTVSVYITFTYVTTFSTVTLKLPLHETFLVQMATAAFMVVLTPLAGAWSDRIGRKPLMIGSLIGYLLVLYPAYAWLTARPFHHPAAAGAAGHQRFRRRLFRRLQHRDCGAVPGQCALARHVGGLQHRGDDLRRLRAVHRHLADPRHRLADGAGVLRDDRRGGGIDLGLLHPRTVAGGTHRLSAGSGHRSIRIDDSIGATITMMTMAATRGGNGGGGGGIGRWRATCSRKCPGRTKRHQSDTHLCSTISSWMRLTGKR